MQNMNTRPKGQKQERREYFRVEDLLPIAIRKVDEECSDVKGKTIPGLPSSVGYPTDSEDFPENSVSPAIWRMLTEIDRKLTILMDNIYLASQGLTNIQMKKISLSASGIRVTCSDKFEQGDYVEVRILLTANTSYWIIVYGKVIRITQINETKWEVGIEFFEMGDEVRNAISAYMISRQREMICKGA